MKALVLAGGFPQIKLITELKKRGYFVILADYNEDPVARKYCDKFYKESTLDVNAIKKIAQEEKVDFLITACTDQALLTVAKVSEELHLSCYIDYKTALNVTNKQYMKDIFVKNGISTAKHIIMEKFDESKIKDFAYPMIVKPVDCNSSKGVIKVFNIDELKKAFELDIKLSRTKTAIIEEFIDGPELTVDVYVENGIANILSVSISDKINDADKFVIYRTRWPALITDELLEKIKITAQQIADSFNLTNSPMLIQMITDKKDVFVLEFSARTGGGVKYSLIQKASGFDVINAVIDLTIGNNVHYEKSNPESKFLSNVFIYCKPGIFDRLEGFDELKTAGIISDYYLFKWKGAEFDGVSNSGDRIAGFTVQADSIEDIKRKYNLALEKIKVLDGNNNDIMRHDLLEELDFEEIKLNVNQTFKTIYNKSIGYMGGGINS